MEQNVFSGLQSFSKVIFGVGLGSRTYAQFSKYTQTRLPNRSLRTHTLFKAERKYCTWFQTSGNGGESFRSYVFC